MLLPLDRSISFPRDAGLEKFEICLFLQGCLKQIKKEEKGERQKKDKRSLNEKEEYAVKRKDEKKKKNQEGKRCTGAPSGPAFV